MPFEVTCGQCHGPLLVEQGGVVVECPTCGAHLEIPADAHHEAGEHPVEAVTTEAETSSPATLPEPTQDVLDDGGAVPETEPFISHSSPYLNHLASHAVSASDAPVCDILASPPPEVSAASSSPVTGDVTVMNPSVESDSEAESREANVASESQTAAMEPPAPPVSVPIVSNDFTTTAPDVSDPVTVPPTVAVEPALPTTVVAPAPAGEMVSKQLFFYVATYASAITLVVLYLVYSMMTHRDHALESLPDIEPPMQQGKIGMKTAKPGDDVPRGHVLRLGESQRFGSVRVTPLRITRGPVTFEHLFGDKSMVRDPSRPVYKLWLKFENVSKDQEFVPLSTAIVYKRHSTGLGKYKTNNFLAAEKERVKKDGDIYYLFGLSETSEFALSGQKLNQPLPPGGTWETYLAAEDSLDAIEGDWMWRVFFRKGFNPSSHRGVTTVIDVRFDGNAVAADGDESKAS